MKATEQQQIIPESEYNEMLRQAGLEEISNISTGFSGDVSLDGMAYGRDVKVGDICTIQNDDWNVHINSRLVEVIESIDESGRYAISPSFCQ